MSKRTPKNHKNSHNTLVILCRHEKKLKAIRGNGYRFVPKGGTFPTENHHACCEKAPVCEKHIPKPAPNRTKFVPCHVDAAP